MTTSIYNILQAAAEANDLTLIETTTGTNGYPRELSYAIICFENWDQLEKLQKELTNDLNDLDENDRNDASVETLHCHRRDGWQLWERSNVGGVWEAYDLENDEDGTIYHASDADDEEKFYDDEVRDFLADFDNLNDLQDFINDRKSLFDQIYNLTDDQILVVDCNGNREVKPGKAMSYFDDTHHYAIGLTIC